MELFCQFHFQYRKNKTMKFLLGELFCGPGGLAYGAGLAGHTPIRNEMGEKFSIEHLWGVDKDPNAIRTYIRNVATPFGGEGICTDAIRFAKNLSPKHAKITALAFGFPCNDFSHVGEQKGIQGEFGGLYQTGIQIINQANPAWFIAENVSGINSANRGMVLKKILGEMTTAGQGYTLTANLYKFEEYGVPQYRHRFIIVGIRNDLGLKFKVPKQTHAEGNFVTASQALAGLDANNVENMTFQRIKENVIKRLKLTPPWHNAWYLDALKDMSSRERRKILKPLEWYQRDLEFLSDEQIETMLDEAQLHCTAARMSHIYKRLQANRPSYTITGSGGGGTHVYHWAEHRSLTNRERARLQTFPDDFVFEGTSEKVRKQIGMAVPPAGARIIFDAILKTFAGIPYEEATTEYNIEALNTLTAYPATGKVSLEKFKDELSKGRLIKNIKFQFSEDTNIYIKRIERGIIYYTCKRKYYQVHVKDVILAHRVFYRIGKLSIALLQEHHPRAFAPSKLSKNYNAFLVISILAKLKIGSLKHTNGKSQNIILEPLLKNIE